MNDLYLECNEKQLRQLLDARTVFEYVEAATKEAASTRGSMFWRTVNGAEYLIRSNSSGGQHSLGRRSADTEAIFERFTSRKAENGQRLQSLQAQLTEAQKLNRVFGVGRAPNIIVSILQELERAGLGTQFMTVGTHALYAYEMASGVRITPGALATQDIDLLFDTRKRVAFMTAMKRIDSSLIAVLQKADPTFKVRRDKLQTAVNATAFEVDLIRRTATEGDQHPMRMSDSEDDFWAAQIDSGQRLISGRRFEQVIVSSNGQMARMRTIHPLDFIAVKRKLAESPSREVLKRPRDALQAQIVQELWDNFLQHVEAPPIEQAGQRPE